MPHQAARGPGEALIGDASVVQPDQLKLNYGTGVCVPWSTSGNTHPLGRISKPIFVQNMPQQNGWFWKYLEVCP